MLTTLSIESSSDVISVSDVVKLAAPTLIGGNPAFGDLYRSAGGSTSGI